MSFAQHGEDEVALRYFGHKRRGIFVDIGAMDGVDLSNTYLLEQEYGWRGVCVEAIPDYFLPLSANRPNSVCVGKACWPDGPTVSFRYQPALRGYSGIKYNAVQEHRVERDSKITGNVEQAIVVPTIHPNEVFALANGQVDFLSIDVEGAEIEILSALDWTKYKPTLICIENPDGGDYEKTYCDAMVSFGYQFYWRNAINFFYEIKK